METVFLWEMTWQEIEKIIHEIKVAVIPTGSTEQHGPHLPLQHDIASALYIARSAAEELYPTIIVTPPISIGVSSHHMGFPGTLTLREKTLVNLIFDVCQSLKHHGIRRIVILNGHGDNVPSISIAAARAKEELGLIMATIDYWELIPKNALAENLTPDSQFPGHACEFETSIGYVIYPEMVRKEKVRRSDTIDFPPYQRFLLKSKIEYSKNGVFPAGDPTLATLEKGKKLLDVAIEELIAYLKEFSKCET